MTRPAAHDDRSLIDLFRDLSQQAYWLIRQEVALAKTEVSERAHALINDALWIGAGVLVIHMALGALVAAAVLALSAAGVPPPAAAALVGAVLVVVGVSLVQFRVSAIRRRRVIAARTIQEMQEAGPWLRDQTS